MTTLPPEENGETQAGGQPSSDAPAPSAPTPPPAAPAPGAPQQPSYQAPPQQPTYQAPPQQPSYQAPPQAGAYQQQGYQPVGVVNPVGNLQLNYWLSVFFSWIPALIFFLVDKDKGDQRLRQLHAANLNFSLLRTFVYVAQFIFTFIPYIGWVVALLLIIAQIVLFVFHIIAAAKVAQAYQTGQPADPFIFNLPMVK